MSKFADLEWTEREVELVHFSSKNGRRRGGLSVGFVVQQLRVDGFLDVGEGGKKNGKGISEMVTNEGERICDLFERKSGGGGDKFLR